MSYEILEMGGMLAAVQLVPAAPAGETYNSMIASSAKVAGELARLAVVSMVLERALSFVFDSHWFKTFTQKYNNGEGWKSPITLVVAWTVCATNNFDIMPTLFQGATPSPMGVLLTALVVAGGSAGAIALFQGYLGFSRAAREGLADIKKAEDEARLAEANAKKQVADASAAKAKAEAEAAVTKPPQGPPPPATPKPTS